MQAQCRVFSACSHLPHSVPPCSSPLSLCQRQLKAQQQRGSTSQELSALKTENANASLLPEDGEKAAQPEERTDSARLLQGQEEEQERLRDAGQAGTASISQDIEIQVENGKELKLKEQLDALRREHTETLQELRGAHEQEKLLLTESHHRSEAALQEKIQALNSQLKSFQERMKRVEESLLRTDYKKHIQEHGSPSPFWEQELESLHFVIEMKNEHIHGLDKKLLHLETVEERNLLLEEKVKTLQQENEDLQVRTQNHLVMARQLSEELQAARGALEKEAQLLDQARREKEELLYRVLNAGDGTPFPMAAGEVPLIAT
ncbi:PREDICTED: coiled-coil domain-containing protein 69 isoform X1 [Sturnus vulgaris]|uniref:coiled-coil domain-containing protein 69 isoform X1 n=1 Tax=Sturnus vulgaris TaxID=9172 RepID=UPI00071A2BFE|nr:PREDICTED: coiled-coil domain-containing protein 69 isoform X1 [Sturnus vulgaris]